MEGMAIGTQASPSPVAGEDSNTFARMAEMGWTNRELTLPLDISAGEKYKQWLKNRMSIWGCQGEKQSESRVVTKREHSII